jgi:hypothetical protein
MVMKNIHLIPTDKPSRLTIRLKTDEIMYSYKEFVNQKYEDISLNQNQHIYITSDEETKENTWCFAVLSGQVFKNINRNLKSSDKKKIILTTDQDLIADGVQNIDDAFLEWFVKNPSCEVVKVIHWEGYSDIGLLNYEIIIPQEEPKQEKERGLIIKKSDGSIIKQETLEETAERLFPKEKHPTSFETLRKAFISSAGRQQRQQEKLEKLKDLSYWRANAEEDYMKVPISVLRYITELENRMHSEVFEWLSERDYLTDKVDIIRKEFEQFKKK